MFSFSIQLLLLCSHLVEHFVFWSYCLHLAMLIGSFSHIFTPLDVKQWGCFNLFHIYVHVSLVERYYQRFRRTQCGKDSAYTHWTHRPPLCVVPAALYQSSLRNGRPSNMAPCRNLCERVAVRQHNGSLYDKGMKYCPKCAIFFRSDEKTHCFCCGKKLRVRTHNSRTRNRNRCSKCNRKL